jgi:hypothetical protein
MTNECVQLRDVERLELAAVADGRAVDELRSGRVARDAVGADRVLEHAVRHGRCRTTVRGALPAASSSSRMAATSAGRMLAHGRRRTDGGGLERCTDR